MDEMKNDEEMRGQDFVADHAGLSNGDDESAAGERNYPSSTVVENNNGEPPPIETSTDNNKVESSSPTSTDHLSENKENSIMHHSPAAVNAHTDAADDNVLDDMGSVVKEPEPTTPNTLVSGSETEDETGVDDEPPKKNELMKLKEEGAVPTDQENGDKKKNSLMEQEVVSAEEHPPVSIEDSGQTFYLDRQIAEGDESGNEEEQTAFIKELENFFRERNMEFKPPKFYGEGLNCLKLWRAVIRLGGYDQVTTNKLWRQVGQYFKPPKTCTTVSWTFRCFYEKALLDFERHKIHGGEIHVPVSSLTNPISVVNQLGDGQASGSGRARRDAAARAMQGWHSRLLGNSEVGDPLIKDKNSISGSKREKQLKSFGVLKRKKPSDLDYAVNASHNVAKTAKIQMEMTTVVDIGPVADWVKVNVRRTRDCFEVYALVPGLLREEVRVQSDPAGRLVISGEPEQPDNPWGVTPFKKVINLPSRIDPHQTSAIVTLHGQLFVRVPFDQSYS